MIAGDFSGALELCSGLVLAGHTVISEPEEFANASMPGLLPDPVEIHLDEMHHTIVTGSELEQASIFACPGVPTQTKALSALYNNFPMYAAEIAAGLKVVKFEIHQGIHGSVIPLVPTADGALYEGYKILAACGFLLAYQYHDPAFYLCMGEEGPWVIKKKQTISLGAELPTLQRV